MTLRRLRACFHTLRAECAACFSLFGRVPFLHNGACAVCFAVRRFCRRNTLVFPFVFRSRVLPRGAKRAERSVHLFRYPIFRKREERTAFPRAAGECCVGLRERGVSCRKKGNYVILPRG